MINIKKAILLSAVFLFSSWLIASDIEIASLRGDTPLAENGEPPRLANTVNDDERQTRAYPQLPPLVAHKIENYQIDLRANKCLSCHARQRTSETGAPMPGVSHYQNRDGEYLADISPARYFCTQCHVPQTDADVIVESNFIPMDQLLYKHKDSKGGH
ncbi:nitrate reductase cytochrome c-type subunit [Marinicellulosiphila megalodicopiae]|uniref:nitrate reductase cytochrome c-type subunit n=1 Tax=Marinicellulosiphila megalodicopiae TaxID=2724896 RepID=UPI003BAE7E07